MSNDAVGWAIKHSPLNGTQLVIHLMMADVVNDAHDNEFYMSVSRLALKARAGNRTVWRTLEKLQELGLLHLIEGGKEGGRPSRYRFLMPDIPRADGGVPNRHTPVPSATEGSAILARGTTKNSNGTSDAVEKGEIFLPGTGWVKAV